MKVLLIAALMFVSGSAFAKSQEPVNVLSVQRIRNLMPSPVPGGNSTYAILEVRVASGGCTQAEDFKVVVKASKTAQTLTVLRLKQDICEMFKVDGEILQLNARDLSPSLPIKVSNPEFVIEQSVH